MKKLLTISLFIPALAVVACSPPPNAPQSAREDEPAAAREDFEAQVEEYIRLFPYQNSFDYALLYTNGNPAKLNTWVIGAEPSLVKAGEDRIVRMNNDTFYKLAIVHLSDGPVTLTAEVPDKSRFVSFQLMDDRNVNYANLMYPNGTYTLFHGEQLTEPEGTPISVPSETSWVIVRVEIKDTQDAADLAAAKAVFNTVGISGPIPSTFPAVSVLGNFDEAVVEEGNRRMDEAAIEIPYRLMVVGPGKEPGIDVPYLNHSAGTKGGWGGPSTEHSAYEGIFVDGNGDPLVGANGTYSVTTEEPPVDAFWSVTVYDTDRGGFLHPNKDDRYHINNTTAVKNEDGTVTFLFKQSCDGDDTNCLEVPAGHFDLSIRYYLPDESIQSGDLTFPGIELHAD